MYNKVYTIYPMPKVMKRIRMYLILTVDILYKIFETLQHLFVVENRFELYHHFESFQD